MAATTHKGSKTKTAKQRRPSVKTSVAGQTQTIAELRQRLVELSQRERTTATENTRLVQELKQALEQQTATSEILRVIASSPTDNRPVLDGVAENAARLCDANDAVILRLDGDSLKAVAHHGPVPAPGFGLPTGLGQPISRGWPVGRAVVDRETVHVHDLAAAIETEFPDSKVLQERIGTRTALATPLLREGIPIGGIFIRRTEVRPFTEKQIALLKTFADQAVIAIENVRLFQELKEALEQQTATSEILGVIASSPTDLQPVLNTIAENAARVCGSYDAVIRLVEGNILRMAAHHGPTESGFGLEQPLIRGTVGGRAVIDRQTIHIHDLLAESETEFAASINRAQRLGNRTYLATPLLREGAPIGVILIRRKEVQPFSEKQVALLKTFADQAVIAIENVRLFKELQERNRDLTEALEQQTATGEVLRVIAFSPTELQPVLDTLLANAVKLSGAKQGHIRQFDGEVLRVVAHYNESPERTAVLQSNPLPLNPNIPGAQAFLERNPIHVLDVQLRAAEVQFIARMSSQIGIRTLLAVPLLREGTGIGTITIWRDVVEPFTDRQIELVKTFADQAVIAIENVRLFNELQTRNRELTESLEQQTATSEILGVIASSPTDIQPVLNVVAENAAKLCDAIDGVILRPEGDRLRILAKYGPIPTVSFLPLTRAFPPGRAVIDRETIHIHDIAEVDTEYPDSRIPQQITGVRTVLNTPLLREGVAIGCIGVRRTEVRPFSEKQIALLKTFADQAVIAIENVRLFKELQERNSELREALEHQTATSEVLSIISRSPTDVQPVLDAIVESAARVCGIDDLTLRLRDGDALVSHAHFGSIPIVRREISMGQQQHRWMREHGALHIPDTRAQNDFPDVGSGGASRTILLVPLRQQGELVGTLSARRSEVRPFTPAQIKLLETFADQAVIALENVRLFQELKESLEQQTATSEILGVIASSPTDIQPVLDVVAQNAARVCSAKDAIIHRVDGNILRRVAHYGPIVWLGGEETTSISRGYASGRAVVDRQTIHIHDMSEESETEFPEGVMFQRRAGHRTLLATPLLREGNPIGTILIRREQVQPFTDKQIALLKTFADQAVIAIENVRLFQELQARNRDLTEALEQQTATSEILRVIASSPTDIKPVLDTLVESAARLCESVNAAILRIEDDRLRVAAAHGPIPTGAGEFWFPLDRESAPSRCVLDRSTIHVRDIQEVEAEFPYSAQMARKVGVRSILATPLIREGIAVGAIVIVRDEVHPYSDKQIALLKTFADQAVIAIENVRLFNELKESLEQQTATSEILGVIASSPTDIQPVLDVIVENAARLCDSNDAHLRLLEGGNLRLGASCGSFGTSVRELVPLTRLIMTGRAIIEKRMLHVLDMEREREAEYPEAPMDGVRTALAVPLLREGIPIGAILIRRREVRPFTDKQVALLETFAHQAVIAIENVRLFKEIQERNAELHEALEHQTATAEVLGIISRSPTDVQPVLEAIVDSAARVCGIDDVGLRLYEGNSLVSRAHFGPIPVGPDRSVDEPQVRWIREHGTLHIPDVREAQKDFPTMGSASGARTFLFAPLRQQGEHIGVLVARRIEVRPFTQAQIKLLETFADQAVIAIENVRLFNELKESLEQQTATSEILGVIASSPTDVQPVLNVVAENAANLCDANDAVISRFDNELFLRTMASYGPIPVPREIVQTSPLTRGTPAGRAFHDRKTIHVHDLAAELGTEFTDSKTRQQFSGTRTILATPLLREGNAIGTMVIRRTEVRPFTEKQIKLLETFAAQAVIAIENVRLFKELQERNAELREALEHQTATAEVLGIVSRSPTDVQPVLDAIVESAARVCGIDDVALRLREGDNLVVRAHFGPIPIGRGEMSIEEPRFCWMQEHGTLHIPDRREQNIIPTVGSFSDWRTFLGVPLTQQKRFIGALIARRTDVRPFTSAQIKLLETFADQAVIAIENVRLFQELESRTRELAQSVEELRALGEVGQAVSSTLDLQTVLNTIVGHAVQLSGTNSGVIYEYDDGTQEFHLRASHRMEDELVEAIRGAPIRLGEGATGRATTTRTPVQVVDLSNEREISGTRIRPIMARLGYRSLLAVPLLREGRIMGALTVWRKEAGSFSPEVVNLLQTFATQSALAIQNARLFRLIEDKNRQVEAANRHKSEFLANMSHELRTPLTAVIGFSEVLSQKVFGELNDKQNEYMDDIISSGRHLLSLINDILDLSKVEAGRMELELTKFDLPNAIDNALILMRERAARHGITLRHRLDEQLGEVVGDERKFKQILLNLLSNAVKFTAEGGHIDVDAALTNGMVEISVSDTGSGIAPENQETIFEEFRQVGTDDSKKHEGTGLGLTLTRKFVELHGGKIWVESAVGKGSTFTFTLPLNQEKFDGQRINTDH